MGQKAPAVTKSATLTLDTFRQANARHTSTCSLAAFLETLTPTERKTVYAAIEDRSIQATAIARVLRSRGWERTHQVIVKQIGIASVTIRVEAQ